MFLLANSIPLAGKLACKAAIDEWLQVWGSPKRPPPAEQGRGVVCLDRSMEIFGWGRELDLRKFCCVFHSSHRQLLDLVDR